MSAATEEPTASEGWLTAGDGTRLHLRSWRPAAPPSAALAVVHGVGEHAGRYGAFADLLARRGVAVHAFDHRGHGLSGGPPVHVDRWERYVDDLDRFLIRTGAGPAADVPLFLLGHSMGSLVALEWAARNSGTAGPGRAEGTEEPAGGVAGLITSGAVLDPHGIAKPWKVAAAKLLSRLVPRFALSLGIAGEDMSRDPDVVRAYRDDPLVRGRATARWGAEALAAVARVRNAAPSIRLPLLALHGADDPLASPEGSRWLAGVWGGDDVRLEIVPDALHEPHNDRCRARVAALVAAWIAARTPDWGGAPGAVE